MRIRPVLFWFHLAAGVLAGAVILLMSVTGVLLTYERQLIAWSDRAYSSTVVDGAARLPLETLLTRAQEQLPEMPASIAVAAAADPPVTVTAGATTYFVDAYSGRVLGESSPGVRRFMSRMRAWHRWFAVEGEGRPAARAITGWSNLLFLFIVASGAYLWIPRRRTWQAFRAVLMFRWGGTAKARDFNWHNVIGAWSAIPLFIVVFSAVPISFPWANALVYRAMGEQPPAGGARQGGGGGGGGEARAANAPAGERGATTDRGVTESLIGIDAAFARAQAQEPDWRTITLRLPASPRAPLAFAIDRGDGGQPQLRSTLTLARADASTVSYETFASQSPARRVRSIMRFAHTGEVLGLPGQTVAGLVTAGSVVLVYTGIALALRRLVAWRARSRSAAPAQARDAA